MVSTPEKRPLVSIIMPCLNAASHIQRAMDSAYLQSFSDFELIVVDNGSTDGTPQLVKADQRPRTRLLQESKLGVSYARNHALKASQGEYIVFLDADDTWHPSFLSDMVGAMESDDNPTLAYCGWQNIGLPAPRSNPFVPPDYEVPDKLSMLLKSCRWPIHAAITRRSSIEAVGWFDTRLRYAEDFLLWLNIAHDKPVSRVPAVLAYYHHHGDAQASANKAEAALQHLLAQEIFLDTHPSVRRTLGKEKVVSATYGELLHRGYLLYWKRDLLAARRIFRAVMKSGYGKRKDWKYMLPALLPESWHRTLIHLAETTQAPNPTVDD